MMDGPASKVTLRLSCPALLNSEELTAEVRWRLVDGLFARVRPAIEGCGAVAIVALTGWARSGHPAFGPILGASLAVIAGRIVLTRRYAAQRAARRGGAAPIRGPAISRPRRWSRPRYGCR